MLNDLPNVPGFDMPYVTEYLSGLLGWLLHENEQTDFTPDELLHTLAIWTWSDDADDRLAAVAYLRNFDGSTDPDEPQFTLNFYNSMLYFIDSLNLHNLEKLPKSFYN